MGVTTSRRASSGRQQPARSVRRTNLVSGKPANGPTIRNSEPVRWDKVLKARQRIAAGAYDDPAVLDAAIARMLGQSNQEAA